MLVRFNLHWKCNSIWKFIHDEVPLDDDTAEYAGVGELVEGQAVLSVLQVHGRLGSDL